MNNVGVSCQRCGYVFTKTANPERCWGCKTVNWDQPMPIKRGVTHKCRQCGYSWTTEVYPKRCAKDTCQSPYWNGTRCLT